MYILAVDDDENFLEVLTETLEEDGHQVKIATSGVEALEMVELEKFDVLLLDLMMPKMDGWSVAGKLRTRKGFSDLPIVLLTGVSDKRWLSDGLLAGANYYIQKDRAFEILPSLLKDLEKNKNPET